MVISPNLLKIGKMVASIKESYDLAPFVTERHSLVVIGYQNFEKWPFFEKSINFQKIISQLSVGR